MNPNICDPRYGQGPAVAAPGAGGPFAAGKGALLTDGASAYFEVGPCAFPAAPGNYTTVLRPLMKRTAGAERVKLIDLTAWLAQHYPDCGDCREGFVDCDHCGYPAADACGSCDLTGKMACACTTRRGLIAGVPVCGWHVRRQLAAIEHVSERVHLARLVDDRGHHLLQVQADGRWTYIRMGLLDMPAAVAEVLPSFPEASP